ncbi:hypothetical protein D3C76_1186410 [compost metagenome]
MLWVEQAQHQLFTEWRWQCGQAQLDLGATWQAALQAAILRAALFGHVHPSQVLDPANQGQCHAGGKGVHGMQQTIDPVAQLALLAARLKVDIAGALFDGVLQQPIDDVHDMGVVSAGFSLAPAQFQQLLQLA